MEIVLALTCVVLAAIAFVGAVRFVRELEEQERRHAVDLAELGERMAVLEQHNADLEALEERHTAELRAQADAHAVELRVLTQRNGAKLAQLAARLDSLTSPPSDPGPSSQEVASSGEVASSPEVTSGVVECRGRARHALAEQYETLLAGLSIGVVSRREQGTAIRYELSLPPAADLADLPLEDSDEATLAWCLLASMKDLPKAVITIGALRIESVGGHLRWGGHDVTAKAPDRLG